MRVTGGIYKGRKLKTAPGLTTRPTTDKIRQAIFNILMNDIEETDVLDLFAGSGALGIEAISRGARSVLFVESGRQPILFIKDNLKSLDLKCEILETDYINACRRLQKNENRFDLIFADPPYEEISPQQVVDIVVQYNLLRTQGLLIIEHKFRQKTDTDRMELLKKRKFGQTEISFLMRKDDKL
jgi:16S rRNA (guanine966-N2)-methyltransferase